MIFGIHYFLTMAGYSACGLLLGNYMIHYTGATNMDLGFVFMIQPFAVITRPLISARADRFQSHKWLFTACLYINALAYLPFIAIPFLLEQPAVAEHLSARTCFWVCCGAHVVGSFSFCGVRSLGDALAVNYAKRIGSDFTIYRKFGAISFGLCGFLLGQVNQNWILPDFVPSLVVYSTCVFVLATLVYLWPDEYFEIVSADKLALSDTGPPLPSTRATLALMRHKLHVTLCGACSAAHHTPPMAAPQQLHHLPQPSKLLTQQLSAKLDNGAHHSAASEHAHEHLSAAQQVRVFVLLATRDVRLPLFMLLLLYGGMVGYAPPSFVFTYMDQSCGEQAGCPGRAYLAGLVMICYCVTETLCYLAINAARDRVGHLFKLQLTLASLAGHYLFYGYLISSLSPYFFIVECLHGLEYSISISSSLELAYMFANEVDLLWPELVERRVVDPRRVDRELVKVSLIATVSACFTMAYEGVGTIVGCFMYGMVIDAYSYITVFRLIGLLALIGLAGVWLVKLAGKCLRIEPQIFAIAASVKQHQAAPASSARGQPDTAAPVNYAERHVA